MIQLFSRARTLLPLVTVALLWVGCDNADPDPVDEPRVLDPDPALVIGGGRPARVVLPDDYDIERTYPLVILLHGFGATSVLQDFIFGLEPRVADRQFILVMPEGTTNPEGDQFWNALPECCDYHDQNVDDVGYITSLIEEAHVTYATDLTHVALVGHSNGGYMTYRMACERPDLIRRIVVLAGSVFLDESDCVGELPVSVLHIHGTEDWTVPYAGDVTGDPPHNIVTVGAEEAIRRWSRKAECESEPELVDSRDYLFLVAGEETEVLSWSGCSMSTDVELWRALGGDHIMGDASDGFRDAVVDFLLDAP